MADFVWTHERTELCKKLWLSGESASLCVQALGGGLTRSAVIGKMNRIGAKRPPGVGTINAMLYPKRAAPKQVRRSVAKSWPHAPVESKPLPVASAEVESLNARPWTERKTHQCAFPVDGDGAETRSCCNPCGDANYCVGHAQLMYAGASKKFYPSDVGLSTQQKQTQNRRHMDWFGDWAA